MNYSKFYTPTDLADKLISIIDILAPSSAIDICCGSCNLLHAAKRRWSEIQLEGVDIVQHDADDVKLFVQDGRLFSEKCIKKFPLVLANPPFSSISTKDPYQRFVEGFDCLLQKPYRLENEMFAANLKLLSDDGTLLIIMPNTFVESEANKKRRIFVTQSFHVEKIIKLSRKAFGSSAIGSYAVIIRNFKSSKAIANYVTEYMELNDNFIVAEKSTIPIEYIEQGIWSIHSNYNKYININAVNLYRGNISSNCFSSFGEPVLHTSSFKEVWKPSLRFITRVPQHAVFASSGDIVINRIGKSAGEWAVHHGEMQPISDCLYCLKDEDDKIKEKIKGEKYKGLIRGVSTQYITKSDVFAWIHSIP